VLSTQVVKRQPGDARLAARRAPRRLDAVELLTDLVAEHVGRGIVRLVARPVAAHLEHGAQTRAHWDAALGVGLRILRKDDDLRRDVA
jgi:hypothetical protein